MSTRDDQIQFIQNKLITEIMTKFPEDDLLNMNIVNSEGLDGFMSAMFTIELNLKHKKDKREHVQLLIAKFMKGDKSFRESSKSYIQFPNEIFIYSKVLPYYRKIATELGSSIKVTEWVPDVYFAKYGTIDGLGDGSSPESALVLEHLKPYGYRLGPPLFLDRPHLLLMAKTIAEYHSFTYAMRIRKDPQLQIFIDEIKPLVYADIGNQDKNLYNILYKVAFERFYQYFDKIKDTNIDEKYLDNANRLRSKYGKNPLSLLEKFRTIDETFSVIQHGDYNRNNVLFQYDKKDGFADPKHVKMIDFQELRYGTPAMDLSFFMYMNTDPGIRDEFWMELLTFYHRTLLNSLAEILAIDVGHESLKIYSFENFYQHFSKFAFYGAMVCMHFMPWKCCSEDECSLISHLFETDMHGDAFWKASLEIGGEGADKQIEGIVRHASRMGYMDDL